MSQKIKITIEVIDTDGTSNKVLSIYESEAIASSKLESIDQSEEAFISSGHVALRQALNEHLSIVSKKSDGSWSSSGKK